MIGIAGLDEMPRILTAAHGLSLNGHPPLHTTSGPAVPPTARETARLGDRAVLEAFRKSFWMSDYSYAVKPVRGGVVWREGREDVFGIGKRRLPLIFDSCGYRREISGSAPKWAHSFENYLAAIELARPDGFAAWDYPQDRQRTMSYLQRIDALYPGDARLWPIFSIRWTWDRNAQQSLAGLPGWAGGRLAYLIPQTRTQRPLSEATREGLVRQAVANALLIAADPDFRSMVERYGKVMLGGMAHGPCSRASRHVFLATLSKLFPDTVTWALGQANFVTVNGLGQLGLLDTVWTDGSFWLKDAAAERFAIVEQGLITMLSLEGQREGGRQRCKRRESFFTIQELMAANLRSLLSAYAGLIAWPTLDWPVSYPLVPLSIEKAETLRPHYQQAQFDLGLQ